MGIAEQQALDYSSTFGGLLLNFGLVPEKAAPMSQALVKLAADMASFSNSTPEEALAALQSGLVGEAEPLRRFQVNLSEARIQAKALELGLWDGKGAIDANAKAQATYAIIMADTARQQGDFARTSGGLANQQREAAAKTQEAWTRLGGAILPIANVVIPALAKAGVLVINVLTGLLTHGRELAPVLIVLGAIIAGTILPPMIGWAVATLAATWPIIALIAAVAAVVAVLDQLGLLGPIIDNFWKGLEAGATFVGEVFHNLQGAVQALALGFLTAFKAIMDVAAAIPGPWQEGAAAVSATLAGMQQDVMKWGTETAATGAEAGTEIADAAVGPIEAAGPAMTKAARLGLKEPIVDQMKEGKDAAVAIASATPGEISSALQAGKDAVSSGADTLKQAFKDHIDPMKEIAALEGDLTGKLMKKGLSSNDPIIRAAAQQWKSDIELRLYTLRNNVGGIALQAGTNFAGGINDRKAQVAAAAAALAHQAEAKIKLEQADKWGQHAGKEWADGLKSMAYYATRAAYEYARGARGAMEFTTPKEGPLVNMARWGEHAGQAWADGFASQAGYLKYRVGGYLSGVADVLQPPPFPMPTIAPPISTSTFPLTHLGAPTQVTESHYTIGDVHVPVTFVAPQSTDAASIREIGRALGSEVRLALVRTSGLFPVGG
jgi:hypothetical protein